MYVSATPAYTWTVGVNEATRKTLTLPNSGTWRLEITGKSLEKSVNVYVRWNN